MKGTETMTTETRQPELHPLQTNEALAQQRLRGWWQKADVHPIYPAANREVVELCNAVGYECSIDTIQEFIEKGYINEPLNQSGRLCWSACDICTFSAALESRQRWKPAPNPLHDPKKSLYRIQMEMDKSATAKNEFIQAVNKYTLEDLTLMLVHEGNPAIRQVLADCLRMKLESMGVDLP